MTETWTLATLWLGLALTATLLSIHLGLATALSDIVVGTIAQLVIGAAVGRRHSELLHHFPGLKPEGVTVSANGGTLAVVFDRDRGAPLWSQVPIPFIAVEPGTKR